MPEKKRKAGFRGPSPDVGKATQWKPGVSGNPGGRPKKIITDKLLVELLRADGKSAEEIAARIISMSKAGHVEMLKVLLDRVEGKARPAEEELEAAAKAPRVIVVDLPRRKA